MDDTRERMLRAAMRPFVESSDLIGYAAAACDFGVFMLASLTAAIVRPIWLELALSTLAGAATAALFVLGHDAAHGSLVSRAVSNRVLGRVLFLPSLHNYTLWRVQHNRLHHRAANVRPFNSWSPYAPLEYVSLPRWRRLLERVYRGGGFGLYYLIERWWRHKFIPGRNTGVRVRRAAWLDFVVLAAWLAVFATALIAIAEASNHSPLSALLFGLVLPFAVWNTMMGLTVFLHHTHPEVPWFRSDEDAARHGQHAVTVHVRYPRWYGVLSHEIMEHPAHHINPLIPFHRLHAAQSTLADVLGESTISERISIRYVASLVRTCKLYDYERHAWTDFRGNITARTRLHEPAASQDA